MILVLDWVYRKTGFQTILAVTLVLAALGGFAFGLSSIVRGFDLSLALTIVWLGLLVGGALAALPMRGSFAGLFAVWLGVEFIIVRVGNLGGKLIGLARSIAGLVWRTLVWAHELLSHLTWRDLPDAQPVWRALTELVGAVNALLVRVWDWLNAVVSGVPAYDPVAVALAWSLIAWVVAVWAGWSLVRREKPFDALLPALGLLVVMMAYTGAASVYLFLPLGATLLLMSAFSFRARERDWERLKVGIAPDLGQELFFVAAALSLALVLLAWATPSVSWRQVVDFIQDHLTPAQESKSLPDSFGLAAQPGRERTAFDQVRAPGMPRNHLVGAGEELSRQHVMYVRTDDSRNAAEDSPPPRHYWRSSTYDTYNGRGWVTSSTDVTGYPAGEAAEPPPDSEYRVVRQEFELQNASNGMLYSTGILLTANHDFHIARRTHDDVFGANVAAGTMTYQADSYVPIVSARQLRQMGNAYPDWVRERYLDLPSSVPERVLLLARDITATELTPYERAVAIETYLRKFPYTTDVAAPPPRRDVVDYFLFDLQKGYCDHYASAMVVLARAAGLPARLVVGYAPGSFDYDNMRFVVTEADAHSWVEVYFPNYGWVEFEPTGIRARIEIPEETPKVDWTVTNPPVELTGFERLAQGQSWLLLLLPGGVLLFALIGAVVVFIDNVRLWLLSPPAAVDLIYRRLVRSARRLGVSAHAAHTPNEVAAMFTARLTRVGGDRKGGSRLRVAGADVQMLTELYVQSCYSPCAADAAGRKRAMSVWNKLRWRLWLVWLQSIVKRVRA